MPEPLSFCNITRSGSFEHLTCHFPAGSTTLMVAAHEQSVSLLARMISGLSRPEPGTILVDGADLAGFDDSRLYDYRRQTAVIPGNGGLISNLKVWENLTLPLNYHNNEVTLAEESSALEYLELFGYHGNLMALPAHLSLHEKRIIGLVRAFIGNPRILVYCDCFDGLSPNQLSVWLQQAVSFQTARPDRISIFLSATNAVESELKPDTVIFL